MLSTLPGERAVRRLVTDSVHPATLRDRSLTVLEAGRPAANTWRESYAMVTTGWQRQAATGVIPASSDRPTDG